MHKKKMQLAAKPVPLCDICRIEHPELKVFNTQAEEERKRQEIYDSYVAEQERIKRRILGIPEPVAEVESERDKTERVEQQ